MKNKTKEFHFYENEALGCYQLTGNEVVRLCRSIAQRVLKLKRETQRFTLILSTRKSRAQYPIVLQTGMYGEVEALHDGTYHYMLWGVRMEIEKFLEEHNASLPIYVRIKPGSVE